jgi:alpha-galactosidase
MNRRHFIKTTGLSLGSFILGSRREDPSKNYSYGDLIGMPDEASVIAGKRSLRLRSSDKQTWSSDGIWLKLSEAENSIAVDLGASEEKLKFVMLTWRVQRSTSVKCLGDQWERSYGDLCWRDITEERIMPWYFMEYDGKATNGFGVKTGCRSLCFWQANPRALSLTIDVRSGGDGV